MKSFVVINDGRFLISTVDEQIQKALEDGYDVLEQQEARLTTYTVVKLVVRRHGSGTFASRYFVKG